jgi:MFS family permease
LFFPVGSDPLTGTLAAFAGFAVGFAARPFGGIVFGHIGDRLGRKTALVLTLSIMGGATFLIGLLPTYSQIGIWAPILLVLLRIAQGVAAGGEWGGVLMISENAPPERRGFYSAWSQVGVAGGFVLSAGAFYLVQLLPQEAFMNWGWRIPFLVSVVIFGLGIYIRSHLPESAEFEEVRKKGERKHLPVVEAIRPAPAGDTSCHGAACCREWWILHFSSFRTGIRQVRWRTTEPNATRRHVVHDGRAGYNGDVWCPF